MEIKSETYLRVREAYEAGELDVLGGQTRLAEELGVTRQAINTNLKRVKREVANGVRRAAIDRITAETRIHVDLDIDGTGRSEISTGVGFYDHVLEAFAKHGRFDLELRCEGDLHVDEHHTMEDCALALGAAFDEALGDRTGIVRMGDATVPLDEALIQAVVDCSGTPLRGDRLRLERRAHRPGPDGDDLARPAIVFAGRARGAARAPARRRQRPPHRRGRLQGARARPRCRDEPRSADRRRDAEHQGHADSVTAA